MKWILCAVFCSGCAATSLLGYKMSPDFPDDTASTQVSLPGLSAPATITLDAWGVPHVEAQNIVDLARATGFAQGRARFFEMDLMRRLAQGRLSELVGAQPLLSETTVDYDRTMRGWQLAARASANLSGMSAEQAQALKAFTEGANAALKQYPPLEYRLLRVEPEPWKESDSLAVGLLNVWSVTHNWTQEATRLVLALSLGVERAQKIYPNDALPGGRTLAAEGVAVLPPGVVPEVLEFFPTAPRAPVALNQAGGLGIDVTQFGGASNAWVVSGAHTVTGSPLVANDPHLTHLVPSIVLQQHLRAPGLDVIGITVPGVPWVLAGHNAKVAWGMTSTVGDAIDLLLEKSEPGKKDHVLDAKGACPVVTRTEVIQVKGADDQNVALRSTCHGPVFNDLFPHLLPAGSPLVSIRWNTEGLENSLEALLNIDRVNSVAELGDAVGKLPATLNTWTSGDVDGHIGVHLSGSIPVRPNHRGTFPVPGWLAKYEWTGFASGDQLPHAIDPPSGRLAHANNLMREPGVPGFVTPHVDAAPGFRHDRIVSMLEQTPKHDVASFRRVQNDVFSLRAQSLLPLVLKDLSAVPWTGAEKLAFDALKGWDCNATADSVGAAVFFPLYRFILHGALDDELDAEGVRFFLAQRYSTNTADLWFSDDAHVVWDDLRTPATEKRGDTVVAAFKRAVASLGSDVSQWRWGRLHQLSPRHPFGGKSALAGMVNLQAFEAGGELDSVWKSHFDMGNDAAPFKVVAGPVYRMVADLKDLRGNAWWVIDTGASGWPKAPHYADQFEKWKAGELVPMSTDLDALKAGTHGSISLTP